MRASMIRANDILSDEELEECIDGSSDLTLIRNIIETSQDKNAATVDVLKFAAYFTDHVNDFIDAKPGTNDYDEASTVNWEWGRSIATNINEMVYSKWMK